jgi:hypothetical protein
MKFNIAIVTSIRDNEPTDITLSYDELLEKLTTFPKAIKSKFDNSGFIGGQFGQKRRKTENLISRTLITLDVDNYNSDLTSLEAVLKRDLGGQRYIAYSTASHTFKTPKIRIVILLTKDIPTASYNTVVTNFVDGLELAGYLDQNKASEKPNQLMFLPTRSHENYVPWFQVNEGELLNPDYYIVDYGIKTNHSGSIDFESSTPKKINILDKKVDNVLIQIKNQPLQISVAKVKATLEIYKDEDCNYDQWLEVGMALSHQFSGKKEGCQIWWDWCKNNAKFDKAEIKNSVKEKWRSFGESSNPVRFSSIMKKAKVNEVVEFKRKAEAKGTEAKDAEASGIKNNIPRYKFLHTIGEKLKPLNTLQNFKILLEEYNITIQSDVILKRKEVWFDGVIELDLNIAVAKIKSLCIQNEMSPVSVMEYTEVEKHEVNTWRDWIESKSWDGQDRFAQFCTTVEVDAELEATKAKYLRLWLMQMIHMSCLNDGKNGKMGRLVLVFQSPEYAGKTSWFRALCPDSHQDYLAAARGLNTNDSMSILACIQNVFVELGEIGGTFKLSDKDSLKNFISSTVDILNIKYVANPISYRRRTVFFGSVNEGSFLTSGEGNTRYLVLPVDRCDAFHNIDMQQLYAQLYAAAKEGEGYELDLEFMKTQKALNSEFENPSYLQEKFTDVFNTALECRENVMSIPAVLHNLGFVPSSVKQTHMTEISRILKSLGYSRRGSKPRHWRLPPLK